MSRRRHHQAVFVLVPVLRSSTLALANGRGSPVRRRGKKFKQSTKMKGLFKSKPCIPADVVRQTRDLLLFVDRIPETRESKCEEKLGNFIHYMATFVFGFVVGFTAVWQLALVTLAVVPIIAVIGGINTTTLAKLSIFTPTEYTITGHCSLW